VATKSGSRSEARGWSGADRSEAVRSFFRRVTRDGAFSPLFVLEGEDLFLRDEALSRIEASVFPQGRDELNHMRLLASETRGVDIVAAASTLPMFAPRRMVVVLQAQSLAASEWAPIAEYAESPEPAAVVVFCASSLDKRIKAVKRVIEAAGEAHVDLVAPPAAELLPWIQRRAQAKGLVLAPETPEELLASIGPSMRELDASLERIALYVAAPAGARTPVPVEAARAVVSDVRSRSVFELMDQIARRDAVTALSTLRSLLGDGESAVGITAMLSRQARQLLGIRAAVENGEDTREAAKLLGVPPFKVRDTEQASRAFSVPTLVRLLDAVARTDARLKSSRIDDSIWLEALILQLCQPGTARLR
jgi:DNA polymerase-3 subunit delta